MTKKKEKQERDSERKNKKAHLFAITTKIVLRVSESFGDKVINKLRLNKSMSVKQLPIFKGYTVDVRLKQFRKIVGQKIIFVEFESVKGEKLLSEYLKESEDESEEFNNLTRQI